MNNTSAPESASSSACGAIDRYIVVMEELPRYQRSEVVKAFTQLILNDLETPD